MFLKGVYHQFGSKVTEDHHQGDRPSFPLITRPLYDGDSDQNLVTLPFSFLGREHGLAGKNNLEAAKAEEVGDVISSAIEKQYHYYFDEEVQHT